LPVLPEAAKCFLKYGAEGLKKTSLFVKMEPSKFRGRKI
jgi:hypothetical protein